MRQLEKLACPKVLEDNETAWLAAYKADPENATKKYRYRHADIKQRLKEETDSKCVYCESKIGHNVPGDVEHKVPSTKNQDLHFSWLNLTIACPECNRRKNDYYDEEDQFLDPYLDDVEQELQHHGPFVSWRLGSPRGEICVRTLGLNSPNRQNLVARKLVTLQAVCNALERYAAEVNPLLKALLARELTEMSSRSGEFSAMIATFLRAKGFLGV